jgi:hypothetical protein
MTFDLMTFDLMIICRFQQLTLFVFGVKENISQPRKIVIKSRAKYFTELMEK